MRPSFLPRVVESFQFKPSVTRHLDSFSEAVMRGDSPLSAGKRELIAAFTSKQNDCAF